MNRACKLKRTAAGRFTESRGSVWEEHCRLMLFYKLEATGVCDIYSKKLNPAKSPVPLELQAVVGSILI